MHSIHSVYSVKYIVCSNIYYIYLLPIGETEQILDMGSMGKVTMGTQIAAILYNRYQFNKMYPILIIIQLFIIPVTMVIYDKFVTDQEIFA